MVDKTYAIFLMADFDTLTVQEKDEMLAEVSGDLDTQRLSLDGLKMIIKWCSDCPDPTNLDLITHTQYTHAQALDVMATAAWTEEE